MFQNILLFFVSNFLYNTIFKVLLLHDKSNFVIET